MTDAEIQELVKAQMREIWMAGFHASGEGFNGEYPFGHPGRPDADETATLEELFAEWWVARQRVR